MSDLQTSGPEATAPSGPEATVSSDETHHWWRLIAIWVVLSAIAAPLFYYLAGPHMPPGAMTNMAEGARFEPVALGTAAERRLASRIQVALDATVVRLNAGANVKPMAVVVRDLSARGVRIECDERFHVTEMFALRFARRAGTPVWVQCEVVRWVPMSKNRFVIGAKFEKMLATTKPVENSSQAQ